MRKVIMNKITGLPVPPMNSVLKTIDEVYEAILCVESIGLPMHPDPVKNWDSLAAVRIINNFLGDRLDARILDAGGEYYSAILKQLHKIGFRDLTCINLVFEDTLVRDGVTFRFGDITKTDFPDNYFDAVTCLSVLEHGVDTQQYFKEMRRILKHNGILITSVDYWDSPVDTRGYYAYGVPVKIFDPSDLQNMIREATESGLLLQGDQALDCNEQVVLWQDFDLRYTFLYFTLMKN